MSLLSLIDPISTLLDKFVPDADEKQKIAFELATLSEQNAQEIATAQIAVNMAEANSKSIFKGGWRPFVGWVCGFALAYVAILEPIMRFIATMLGYTVDFPVIDTTLTMQILMGMLGLGSLRSFEKAKGVAAK